MSKRLPDPTFHLSWEVPFIELAAGDGNPWSVTTKIMNMTANLIQGEACEIITPRLPHAFIALTFFFLHSLEDDTNGTVLLP